MAMILTHLTAHFHRAAKKITQEGQEEEERLEDTIFPQEKEGEEEAGRSIGFWKPGSSVKYHNEYLQAVEKMWSFAFPEY
ncbi:Protein of unknown function [Gryllus bimaculatus]|nr:Protein of unknown function [Gryllus bimaculatus]